MDRRKSNNKRSDGRRKKDRRNTSTTGFSRGIVDRRGQMDRREHTRRMEDKEEKIENDLERIFEDQVEGRKAVLELLETDKDINKIYITKGERKGSIGKIIAIANEKRVVIVEKDKKKMDEMAQTENYQGIIAIVPPFKYSEVEDILDYAKQKKEKPFIIILDGIEDPRNLGAIIRTAEGAGVHGIIIPKRRAVAVNSTVVKTSCGAAEHVKIARVSNIRAVIDKLQMQGIWICGTDINAKNYYFEQDFSEPVALIIGNEEKGVSELVKKSCDYCVKIPMKGKIESLNASVSAGIIIYEIVKQRDVCNKM